MKKPVSVCNAKAIKQTTFHACHICVESLYWGGELQCNDGGGGGGFFWVGLASKRGAQTAGASRHHK